MNRRRLFVTVLVVLIAVLSAACASSQPANVAPVDRVVSTAVAQEGKPYEWGASGPDSFDCSGLAQFAYASAGIRLPRTTYEQFRIGRDVSVDDAQPGDLVFTSFSRPDFPEMVSVYVGDGKVVAATQSGVPVSVTGLPQPATIRRVTAADVSAAAQSAVR